MYDPVGLAIAVVNTFPKAEWAHAIAIAGLESGFDAFAERDTTTPDLPCGAQLDPIDGVPVVAEHSIGYFQINVCVHTQWEQAKLYNGLYNVQAAYVLWSDAGGSWSPWYFSAKRLGLL